MIQFHSVGYEKFVFYRRAILQLDHPGITMLYGHNRDAGKEDTVSNASGKSLLLQGPVDLRYEVSSVPMEAKLKAAKDAWSEGTSVTLSWSDTTAKQTYSASKKMEGSLVYDLTTDGVRGKLRTRDYFRERMAALLPWSEAEWFNLIHIDSRRNSTLQLGSPAGRLQFFTDMFRLDELDEFRKLVKKHLDKTKESAAAATEIEQQIKDLDEQRKTFTTTLSELQSDEQECLAKIDKLRDSVREIQTTLRTASESKHAAKAWSDYCKSMLFISEILQKPDGTLKTTLHLENVGELIAIHRKVIKKLNNMRDASEEWRIYDATVGKVKAKRKAIRSELEDLHPKTIWEPIDFDRAIDLSFCKTSLKDHERQLNEWHRNAQNCEDELAKLDKEPQTSDEVKVWIKENVESFAELVAEIERAREALGTAKQTAKETAALIEDFKAAFGHKHTDATCPTCTQEVDGRVRKAVLAEFEAKLEKAEGKRDKILQWFKLATPAVQYLEEYEPWKKDQALRAETRETLRRLEKKLKGAGKSLPSSERFVELLSELPEPVEKPTVERPEYTEDEIAKKLEKNLELVAWLRQVEPYANHLDEKVDTTDLEQKEAKLTAKLEDAQSKLPDLRVAIVQRKELKKRWDSLQERLAELKTDPKEARWLPILYEGYGSKGVKTMLVRKLAKQIEKGMNDNRGLLFREDIRFEFQVSENEFNILAHRKYKNRTVSSDVRRLSGAESRAFNFLLPLALLPMQPSRKRSNLMILDEPCVNMDQAFKDLFMHKFLPQLSRVVPSIIVITPDSTERVPGARLLRVVKENGISTLTEIGKK